MRLRLAQHSLDLTRAVVKKGATGAIAPVDFGKEAQIAPVSHD